MKHPSHSEVPDLWERDGSFRDVYVRGVSIQDWNAFLNLTARYRRAYSVDGDERQTPKSSAIFSDREHSHLLSVDVSGVRINCHFFNPSEIELDIDPSEVLGESQHQCILEFVESLARDISKVASITPENMPDSPYMSYEPHSGEWHIYPPLSEHAA